MWGSTEEDFFHLDWRSESFSLFFLFQSYWQDVWLNEWLQTRYTERGCGYLVFCILRWPIGWMYYILAKGQKIQVYSCSITSSFTLVTLGFEVRHAVDHLPTIVLYSHVWDLWCLVHQQYWMYTKAPLRYPALDLSHGNPAVLVPHDKFFHGSSRS